MLGVVGTSSFNASVGAGEGSTDRAWVEEQTSLTGDHVAIDTTGHTQLDGALIAANDNAQTLSTGTLGHSDIVDHDERHHTQATAGFSTANTGNVLKGGSISGEISNVTREQITRATVGEGEIVVRDGKADTATLNRDLTRAQEITRDEASGVSFYASTSAVEEAASGFEGIRGNVEAIGEQAADGFSAFTEGLNEVSEGLSKVTPGVLSKLSDLLGLSGSGISVASLKQLALAEGVDQASVDELFRNPEFVGSLTRSLAALDAAYKNGWEHTSFGGAQGTLVSDGRVNEVTLDSRMTDGEKVLYSFGEVRDVLGRLPSEQVQIASLSLQAALGGPFGLVKGYLFETAKDWAFGDAVEKVMASTTQGIHKALTGKKWDKEYGWGGSNKTQSGARLAAEVLIAGAAGGAGAKLGKGIAGGDGVGKSIGKTRNKPPAPLPEAEGRPHTIIEKPGRDGQYTTHHGDGTWKQYRGSGRDHGDIARPNVKEVIKNEGKNGQFFINKGRVRAVRPEEIPGGIND